MISEPGENPSPWFCAAVLTCTPFLFVGIDLRRDVQPPPGGRARGTVNASFGHGSRQ